jgi:hypothetical protein
MDELYILTIGAEYGGYLKLWGNGIKTADIFEETMIEFAGTVYAECKLTTRSLRGAKCTHDNIVSELQLLVKTVNDAKHSIHVMVLYAGHGNHQGWFAKAVRDSYHNCNEYWQTPGGNVYETELAEILNTIDNKDARVMVISESCSSEHMINDTICKNANWITIGATLDYQDAIMDGDGGIMTHCFTDTIKIMLAQLKTADAEMWTLEQFWKQMNIMATRNGVIYDYVAKTFQENFTLHVARPELLTEKMF